MSKKAKSLSNEEIFKVVRQTEGLSLRRTRHTLLSLIIKAVGRPMPLTHHASPLPTHLILFPTPCQPGPCTSSQKQSLKHGTRDAYLTSRAAAPLFIGIDRRRIPNCPRKAKPHSYSSDIQNLRRPQVNLSVRFGFDRIK